VTGGAGEWTVSTLHEWIRDQLAAHRDLIATLSAERARFLDERSDRIDDRFTALEKQLIAALAAGERAAQILETQAKEWRASANEWRGAMQDRDQRLVPRDTYETGHAALEKQVDELTIRLTRAESMATGGQARVVDQRATIAAWVAASTLILAVVVFMANFLTSR
jgi:hypothetical protein